jgi:hypothetical protein
LAHNPSTRLFESTIEPLLVNSIAFCIESTITLSAICMLSTTTAPGAPVPISRALFSL